MKTYDDIEGFIDYTNKEVMGKLYNGLSNSSMENYMGN